MPTQVQIRGAVEATQSIRTLASRELDVNTTDKRINIHDGSTAGGIPHLNCFDAINQEFVYAAATGTNALTMTLPVAPTAYQAGQRFSFKAENDNTGSVTLDVNSLGAKTIKRAASGGAVALEGGEIVGGGVYDVIYDGTDLILISGAGGGGDTIVYSAAIASGSLIELEDIFEAGFIYEIFINGWIPATDNQQLTSNVGNGSTYVTSGYRHTSIGLTAPTTATNNGSSSDTRAVITPSGVGSASNETGVLKLTLNDPNNAAFRMVNFEGSYFDSSAALVTFSGCYAAGTGARSSIRFANTSGNFEAAGYVTVYARPIA